MSICEGDERQRRRDGEGEEDGTHHVGRHVLERRRANEAAVHLHLVLEDLDGARHALVTVGGVGVCASEWKSPVSGRRRQ